MMSTGHIRLFGRKAILDQITQAVRATQPASFVLVGGRLTGKSIVLHQLATQFQPGEQPGEQPGTSDKIAARAALPLVLDCSASPSLAALIEHIVAGLQRTLAKYTNTKYTKEAEAPPASQEAPQPFAMLADTLALCVAQAWMPLLLLDNFDRLLVRVMQANYSQPDQQADLQTFLQQVTMHAMLVATAQEPLYDVAGASATVTPISHWRQCFVGLIDDEAAAQWLASYGIADPDLCHALLTLTGRHPFLLDRLGDALAELTPLLPATQPLGVKHLPLLRLRLTEFGRPLFGAQYCCLQSTSGTTAAAPLIVERLRHAPLRPAQISLALMPALNWLINQALVRYTLDDTRDEAGGEAGEETGLAYALFTPLFADFLEHVVVANVRADARQTAPEPAPLRVEENRTLFEKLTKTEAALLRYFQQHSQTVVSAEQLLTAVWKRPHASNRRVEEAIRRLRLQLEKATPPVGAIRTERGRGYRFVPYEL